MKLEVWGGQPLKGEIIVSGAKNAALKMIAAACLSTNNVELKNVPEILDVKSMLSIFESIGGQIKKIAKGHYLLNGANIKNGNLDLKIVSKLRGSIIFLGPLLARFKKVLLPFPGGCQIGARSIDTHLKLFSDLGATIKEIDGCFEIKLDKIKNTNIILDEISVTATENALLFASFFDQPINFRVLAIEPEIIDLIKMLEQMGVEFSGVGTPFLTIQKKAQDFKTVCHTVLPDRIEAGTWAILAAVSKGDITIKNVIPEHLDLFFNKMEQAGVKIESDKNKNEIKISSKGYFKPVNIDTRPYPGFPTDLQAPFSILMTQARGGSRIFETLFEDRLQYLKELRKMGAQAKILNAHTATIYGPTVLHGKKIYSLDLRAGITLIIAALIAKGKSEIYDIEIVDRGYEDWEEKLSSLDAKIKRKP
jgi:UDP-N-acetylglucosamine 1-carboxyvinyltransferase